MAARYWVLLTDPDSAAFSGRDGLDPFARVRVLADSYELTDSDRHQFPEVLVEAERVGLRFVRDRVEQGDAPFVEMWTGGGKQRHARKMAWLDRNLSRIGEALL